MKEDLFIQRIIDLYLTRINEITTLFFNIPFG